MFVAFVLMHGIYSLLSTFCCLKSNNVLKGSKHSDLFKRDFLKIIIGCRSDIPAGLSCIRDVETMKIQFNKSYKHRLVDFSRYDPNDDPYSHDFKGPSLVSTISILENIKKLANSSSDLKTVLTQYYAFYNMSIKNTNTIQLDINKDTVINKNKDSEKVIEYVLIIPTNRTNTINAKLTITISNNNLFVYQISGNGLLCWETIEDINSSKIYKINHIFDAFFTPKQLTKLQVREGFSMSKQDLNTVLKRSQTSSQGRKEIFNNFLLLSTEDGFFKLLINKKDKKVTLYDENKIMDKEILLPHIMELEVMNLDWY